MPNVMAVTPAEPRPTVRRPQARACAAISSTTRKYGEKPFSSITVGDITSDARRGGQTFSMRISLSPPGAEGAS